MPVISREPRTIKEERDKWCEHIPNLHHGAYRKAYRKAMTGKSKASAIRAKCQDCCNWDKAEIADCRVPTCPLFEYRPYGRTRSPDGSIKMPTIAPSLRGRQETQDTEPIQ